ncbi:nitric oxide reductase activation protein NorD [Tropicimonas sediminicola]|uniref:von Willebrand factor type A domain-containing protein n=1 Tax=Tropicimonas sediminicola TaxID=1031541 RepID=A0A239MEH3_9RHOB|nr:VWA domain-containing protein [Tropicimonas sediminicola]SNT41437.1 von Willebrand factor type A domain-containing protein [Tropicimonas sediminicola]
MTIALEEYRDCLAEAPPDLIETLEPIFHDAARLMSPAGLADYMEGARGLNNLGRGHDLVFAWLENMPAVVKECGEDVIRDCLTAAMKLSSMTSGEVIALLFSSLPTAAQRLGDPELLRGYLALIHSLSAKASRGLRPMLYNIDELLSKLTLSGLRRWSTFGAEAYRRDLPNLTRYFALESADSRKVLQQERRGTLFIDTHRKLNFYLRALWGRDFFLRPTAADHEGFRPYIEHQVLHLPDALDDLAGVSGVDLYRAIAAHQAAHIQYSTGAISAEQLTPAQMFFIGLVEDARVEWAAAQDFPGLSTLWGRLLQRERPQYVEHETILWLERFAALLNDPAAQTGHTALDALGAKFHAEIAQNASDNRSSWILGLELYHVFAASRDVPSLRVLNSIRIPYRDDNRMVWAFEEFDWEAHGTEYISASQRQLRKYVSVLEMAHEVDTELAGDDAQEIWVCKDEFRPYEDAGEATTSFNEMWGKEPISAPFHYHEWDYRVQLHRPDWTTVFERRATRGDPARIDEILANHRPVVHRIRQIVDMLTPAGVARLRGMEDGDEIDLNAAVDAMIAIRMGTQPDPRITMRNVLHSRDLAVTVLLDLSESTNDPAPDSDKTVLDLTREAATLVATAISGIGDPFAIHGFASDGRHDVQYYRFKNFDQHFDDEAKARLDGMRGGLSTRMGAALRHAGQELLKQPERRKLILLLTDGEPADIDERDPQHLRHDTRKAVEELASKGVATYCLSLDPEADSYVKRIFGENNYTIVDHIVRLPEQLPNLFASLTH